MDLLTVANQSGSKSPTEPAEHNRNCTGNLFIGKVRSSRLALDFYMLLLLRLLRSIYLSFKFNALGLKQRIAYGNRLQQIRDISPKWALAR